ncbi:hypothetical protein GCM10027055_08840 [Janibacter alkaliphilus]|uniref:Putative membrane protein n=1 Tax=Janibacter alkaliphilus TaxID=1069963 RepID=A0A852X0Q8_9MICO|nr:DUF2273 domain-containing protein [Janibacter alkaliphilus]NYG36048.1 putative membrane protein [Janibacter alkaliphilus]
MSTSTLGLLVGLLLTIAITTGGLLGLLLAVVLGGGGFLLGAQTDGDIDLGALRRGSRG